MKSIILTIIACCLVILGTSAFIYARYSISKSEQVANQVLDEAAKNLKYKYNIQLAKAQVVAPKDAIRSIQLNFLIRRPLTKEEIRQILVDGVQEVLAMINADEAIRPYLKKYPFEIENLKISLSMKRANGEGVYEPSIGEAELAYNNLTYRTFVNTKTPKVTSEFNESYEDAVRAL